jgi:hypothetical protein
MAKNPQRHKYSDFLSLQRLMVLIATLVNYPGVGGIDQEDKLAQEKGQHHNALELLQQQMMIMAQTVGIELKLPATATLRKDLEFLKDYQILDRRMYRWGYYLGTGVMRKRELKMAFDALESMAIYQGDALAREQYQRLSQRIRGLDLDNQGDFFYPVRRNLNQAIDYTDPEQMWQKNQNRHTLFHYIPQLEEAILKGQPIQVSRKDDFYNQTQPNIGPEEIIPLQLIYYNISWYLLYESCQNNQLIMGRINRFKDYYKLLSSAGRNIKAQEESLKKANKLLTNGWGLNLGSLDEQTKELQNQLIFTKIKVRFYPPVCFFIIEGELRHPKQKIKIKKDDYGQVIYADYLISLPPRSLNEFRFWLQSYGASVEVIAPESLRQIHRQNAIALTKRYET